MSDFAGALRERIAFERRAEPGGDAPPGDAWRHDGAAWAAVTPLGPGARIIAGSLSARPRWRVTVRARGGLDLDSRILWRGRVLMIVAIEEDPRTPDRIDLITEEQP